MVAAMRVGVMVVTGVRMTVVVVAIAVAVVRMVVMMMCVRHRGLCLTDRRGAQRAIK